MSNARNTLSELTGACRLMHWRNFIATPHRMFFFGGVWALVLSMLWWGAVLVSAPVATPAPHWVHGWLLVFCAFPFFVFGFLMTALPRWLGAPKIPAGFYRIAALALMAAGVLTLIGALWHRPLAIAGMVFTCLIWLACLIMLARLLFQGRSDWKVHPIWAVSAVAVGALAALMAVIAGVTSDIIGLRIAPQVALWAFLAPLVFIIGHRMLPFFASNVLGDDYRFFRPRWTPHAAVLLLWLHAALMLTGHMGWLFIADLPLLLLAGWHLVAWQPWKARHNALLWTLFVAFAWLPVAAALSAVQSLALQLFDARLLGFAPLHALAIGLAASMVFAMATRVSLGHSGRTLRMPGFAVICFLLLQVAVVVRIGAELHAGTRDLLLAISALLWLCAFTPWAVRLTLIYWQPRADGQPG